MEHILSWLAPTEIVPSVPKLSEIEDIQPEFRKSKFAFFAQNKLTRLIKRRFRKIFRSASNLQKQNKSFFLIDEQELKSHLHTHNYLSS